MLNERKMLICCFIPLQPAARTHNSINRKKIWGIVLLNETARILIVPNK